jgi:hypothetical protein
MQMYGSRPIRRFMPRHLLTTLWILGSLFSGARASEAPEAGWSAEVLNRILKAEMPSQTAVTPPTAEMILHTYHLSHLRVGEAGKAQNVLAILGKLLPPGSAINPDIPANSLHVLTTASAHKAIWDYLSAVDVTDSASAPAAMPDEVKTAIKKLADAGDQSTKVLTAVGTIKSDVAREIADIDARQHDQMIRFAVAGIGCMTLLMGTLLWMLRRRLPPTPAPAGDNSALVLAPEQITNALTPVHDRMRSDMLGMLNEVAIKLQAQHNEQQKLVHEQRQQLESARLVLAEERRQFISETGTMVVQAVERVDATTAKLAKQQDKVAELVQELQNTVRELDDTKDNLRDKEIELEQERAKIAALSILLDEGGAVPPPTNGHSRLNGSVIAMSPTGVGLETVARRNPSNLCTNLEQPPTVPLEGTSQTTSAAIAAPRFQFLPPEHPES